jgi:hypothetical protein
MKDNLKPQHLVSAPKKMTTSCGFRQVDGITIYAILKL